MDIHQPKPRVNVSQISNFIGSYVTIVGRTQGVGSKRIVIWHAFQSGSVGARTLQVETGDKQHLTVHFQQPLVSSVDSLLYV